MKLLLPLLLAFVVSCSLTAQDIFKQELFATDLIMKYRTDIGLSDAQTATIKKAYSAQIGDFNSLKWDLDAAQNDLGKLLAAAKVDRSAALAQMNKVTSLEEKLKQIRLGMLVDIKNVLSQEQQQQLKKLRTSADMDTPTFHIAAVNENPRVVLKINGDDDKGIQPHIILIDAAGKESVVDSMNELAPDDIASVNVLKGEAAIKKYGDKGKNGVVVITMKK